MWALSEQSKNTDTHPLRVEDMNIKWAVKKYYYAQAKSRIYEHCVSTEQLESTITHRLRVEYVSIERAVEIHDYSQAK